jgi:hypothetical protein
MSGPASSVTVLRAHDGRRLTKRFTVASNGAVVSDGYDKATWYRAASVPVAGLHGLHALLRDLERDPHACVIRGEAVPDADTTRTRRNKAEKGGAFAETPRHWVMLDIDGGVPLPPGGSVLAEPEDAARVLLDVLAAHAPELEGVAALVQFSASAGLDEVAEGERIAGTGRDWRGVAKPGLRAHVWYWLASPLGEAELLRWREGMAAAGLALDAATLRTVQPHYVAAPVFDAPLRDPLAGRRAVLVPGAEGAATLRIPAEPARPGPQAGAGGGSPGRGYAGHLAAIGGPDGFHWPALRAASAFIAASWPAPDLDGLKAELRARILAADPGGRTAAEIADRASERHLQGIIAWAMQQEARKRAAPPPPKLAMAPTFPDHGVPLAQAQARMAAELASYAARLRAGVSRDMLLRVTVGGGKSEAAIRTALELLAAGRVAKPGGALFFLTPRHDLNEELRDRFMRLRPDLHVAIWRGMDAPDPARPGETMCQDPELPRAAADAGLPRTTACIACPLNGLCAYSRQAKQPADIWLAAHNLAYGRKSAGLSDAALLVMDEGIYSAAVTGTDKPVELALSELLDKRTGAVTGRERDELLFFRRLVFDVLERHGEGGLLREAFAATGLTADRADEWQKLEWDVQPKVELAAGLPRDGILSRLHEARSAGFSRKRPMLARYVRELLRGDAVRSVNVTIAPGGATLHFAWREDFAAWAAEAPKLFLDGTAHPDLLRVWSPDVEVVDVEVAAPHQHIRQVPQEFGRSFFVGKPENVRRLGDLVMTELALTQGDVLIVAQKAVLDLLRKDLLRKDPQPRFVTGKLPARLHLVHHGAVTGMNCWAEVERAVIVGRPALNRRDGERLAEIIKGAPVAVVADQEDGHWPRVDAGIRMADGTGAAVSQPRHPDPLVEAIRWTISEGAVLQAIGRPRGVRRDADAPVLITVLAAMALPLTVQEVATWEDVQPDRLDVAMAEAALHGRALPLAPADLSAARPDLWETEKAVERFLEERRKAGRPPGLNPQTPYRGSYKGFGGFSPPLARYRKPGARRWSLAAVPPEGGHAALVAEVGELAAYEPPDLPPPPSPPPRQEATMPDPDPAPAQEALPPAAFGLRRVGPGTVPLAARGGLTIALPQEAAQGRPPWIVDMLARPRGLSPQPEAGMPAGGQHV